jgi:hypothetical protein
MINTFNLELFGQYEHDAGADRPVTQVSRHRIRGDTGKFDRNVPKFVAVPTFGRPASRGRQRTANLFVVSAVADLFDRLGGSIPVLR